MSNANNSIPVTQDNDTTMQDIAATNEDNNSSKPKKRSRKEIAREKRKAQISDNVSPDSDVLLDILDTINAKSKMGEKRTSAESHFDYFLAIRNNQLVAEGKEPGKSTFEELDFNDIDKGPYIGEFGNYIAKIARSYMNPKNDLISYQSAIGYMGAIKCHLIDKYHRVGVPQQLKEEVWKRKMTRIRSIKAEQAKQRRKPMFGSKEAASDADRMGILAICIWTGNVLNAEFLNFFQSMVMNCGRGSEIGVTKFEHLNLKRIQEDYGLVYDTLEQYVNRSKTEGTSKSNRV